MQRAIPISNDEFQAAILPGVSRTFALTIPQLPSPLCDVVSNAYLLCRIADTIEDDPELHPDKKELFHQQFVAVLSDGENAEPFSTALHDSLSQRTVPAERDLVLEAPRVVAITRSFSPQQQRALQRCVAKMCQGMPAFQRNKSLAGLSSLAELDRYCYFVAGVVGELLTELFCAHSAQIEARRESLEALSVSFGQGLQMTNILKDIWEDRSNNTCWLPRDVFEQHGFDVRTLAPGEAPAGFRAGLTELLGVAHAHLRNALRYTLLIPSEEIGIRRFCLWAIGLAVLTLRRIYANMSFTAASEVKVSRRTVRATIVTLNLFAGSDRVLESLFGWAARGLPHSAEEDRILGVSEAL